jgi:hypothetical protein
MLLCFGERKTRYFHTTFLEEGKRESTQSSVLMGSNAEERKRHQMISLVP